MRRLTNLRNDLVVLLSIVFALVVSAVAPANAQDKEELLKLEQIALVETQITGYLKIGSKLNGIFERIDKSGGEPDKQLRADLEALAKEGGFKSFDELEAVVSNITFVMSGINEDDGNFKEPIELLKQELSETENDATLKADDKKQLIAAIRDSMAHTPKLKHPGNVDLVKKHFAELVKLFQQ